MDILPFRLMIPHTCSGYRRCLLIGDIDIEDVYEYYYSSRCHDY